MDNSWGLIRTIGPADKHIRVCLDVFQTVVSNKPGSRTVFPMHSLYFEYEFPLTNTIIIELVPIGCRRKFGSREACKLWEDQAVCRQTECVHCRQNSHDDCQSDPRIGKYVIRWTLHRDEQRARRETDREGAQSFDRTWWQFEQSSVRL